MKIEDQVCSLELAKKLKELGVKQDSLLYWLAPKNPNSKKWFLSMKGGFNEIYNHDSISAFTASELGEILPSAIKQYYWLKIINWYEFELSYIDDNNHVIAQIQDDIEVNARAKMLIYLIENGLYKQE